MSKYRLYEYQTEYRGKMFWKQHKQSGQSARKSAELVLRKRKSSTDEDLKDLTRAIKSKDFWQIGVYLFASLRACSPNDDEILLAHHVAGLECLHRINERKTIFLPSFDLIEAIYSSNIEVCFESITQLANEAVLAFAPQFDLVLGGVAIRPFIFDIGNSKYDSDGFIGYCVNRQEKDCYPVASMDGVRYKEIIASFKKPDQYDEGTVYLKLATSLFCYMRAFPECVVPGIPSDMSIKEMMHGGPKNKRTGFTIKAPIDAATGRALHLRRGHFRSLHDERFKRNDDGSIKIVWVRESVVGGKIDPYTVEAHAV